MNHFMQKIKIVVSAFALTLYCAAPAVAEDIEIYKKENLGALLVRPNILFILDTSGSMNDEISDRALPADPITSGGYSACAGFTNDKMYYLPSRTSLDEVTCTSTFTDRYFNLSQNQCDALVQAFALTGVFSGTFAQWSFNTPSGSSSDYKWDEPRSTASYKTDRHFMECKADLGDHGNGGAELYIDVNTGANGSEYTTDATNAEANWGRRMSDTWTFYSGDYLNYIIETNGSVVSTPKIDIMRSVIEDLMTGVNDVNIGLMRFNTNGEGGTVKHPVLDVAATRNDMFATMRTWTASGWTPLSETLYEAYLYFAGKEPYYPDLPGGESVEGSTTITEGGTKLYDSPVDTVAAECQKQFVILLSDGEPTSDSTADSKIEAMMTAAAGGTAQTCTGSGSGHCLDDLAQHLNEVGFSAYLGATDGTVNDIQIQTYTVGFAIQSQILEDAGNLGGGGYKEANSSTDLLQTLIDLVNRIKGIDTSFAAPAVSVNAFNRTTHRSDLFFTLFQPSTEQHWDGNFKKYRLSFDTAGVPAIYDANNALAVDATTGFFGETAKSFWTPAGDPADGKKTEEGGAASVMTDARNVYTAFSAGGIRSTANAIHEDNADTSMTNTVLGLAATATTAERQELLQWARGLNTDGTARKVMGDPLHGQPALIQYGGTFNPDGTEATVDITAYVVTNDGYLHAFDITTGAENFAYVPAELLPNLDLLKTNATADKIYGLDGTVNALVKDINEDGIIAGTDKTYIFFGMRRGGSNYYGLDVTDRSNPQLMWTIKGGIDINGDPVDTTLGNYSELGQTWSAPQVRKIKYQGSDLDVLIFGGGYDADQDTVTTRTADDIGRGLFIVDAMSGRLLFRIGQDVGADLQLADMDYSIPSDVTAVDSNGDDYVDHLYVGDMGGQVWRIDIDNVEGATADATFAAMITGGRIADLASSVGNTPLAIDNRRFYYPPDIALMKKRNGGLEFNLIIGSGYRAHPTDKVIQDRIYMLQDLPISGKPDTYVTLTESNLFDTTENTIGDGTTDAERDAAAASLAAANGYYISLNVTTGEKALTKPLIFDGEVFFTTYEPFDAQTGVIDTASCQPPQGSGYLYYINLNDGTPGGDPSAIVDHADELTCSVDARCNKLTRSGIPADPTAIMTDEGEAVCVSTECKELTAAGAHKRLFWFEQ